MANFFIDAGHGGNDPGAVGKNSNEKTNVLNVSLKLGKLLTDAGHSVRYSRTTDKFLSLSERARLANNWGADAFISLHNNSHNSNASGFETFIFNGNVSDKTKQLQNAVHDAIASKIDITDRGKKQANYAVLRQTQMPAVLIEYAFISNTGDEDILINQVDDLAQWTADGLINFASGKVSKPAKKTTKKKSKKITNKTATNHTKTVTKANLAVDGKWGKGTTRALQRALGTPVDGIISRQPRNSVSQSLYGGTVSFGSGSSNVIVALQRKVGATADGKLGPATVRALQRYLGTPVDGVLSRPSVAVRELQRRLNAGTF